MNYLLVPLGLIIIVIIFFIILKKSAQIQEQLRELQAKQKELLQVNSMLKIEKEDLQERQEILDKELSIAKENNERKQEEIDQFTARQLEFHIIKFGRIPAWGSPSYSISVDALGNVLYHGKESMRMIGFYQWKIYRKRIKNINSIIKKSNFFHVKESEFKSNLDDISGVVIEIFLKNGVHKRITFDHAADYPMDLGFLERKLDLILGTKKLWLYWSQNIVKFSIKRGLNYKAIFIANQGVLYTILGQETFSAEPHEAWDEIDSLVQKHESTWSQETTESFKNHPRDTIWVELESGFRFLISSHKHTAVFQKFAKIVEDYGKELQKEQKKKKGK